MPELPGIVDLTLWMLGALSVLTWAILLYKLLETWLRQRDNRGFLRRFDAARRLAELDAGPAGGRGVMAALCRVGLEELRSLARDGASLDDKDRRALLAHALRREIHRERILLERGLAVLASIGSTAPFIGLFGTVWGIMNALQDISRTGSAGLDVVAGPIGEALIATAWGIAAAIPAVLAYNHFTRRVRVAVTEMEQFADRFLHLAIRSGMAAP